jgi:hypothetical protein
MGLASQPGSQLWLRWIDINDPASDHGRALDDFSIWATAVSEPMSLRLMLAGLGGLLQVSRRRGRRCVLRLPGAAAATPQAQGLP